MKIFIKLNWFMFRFSLVLGFSIFILSGFNKFAFGLIPMVMIISLITSVIFFEKDENYDC